MSEELKTCAQQKCGEHCENCSYRSICSPDTKALLTRSDATISRTRTESEVE